MGERLTQIDHLKSERLRQIAREILLTTGHRGALKYALALLGWLGGPEEIQLIETVGRHPEFTLYAGVALANRLDDPFPAWLRLAQGAAEWARVDLVERLCHHPSLSFHPEAREWLLTEACTDYLVAIEAPGLIATSADLLGRLREPALSPSAFLGTVRLLAALLGEGPSGQNMLDIEGAPEAIRLFLDHASAQRPDLELGSLLLTMRTFLGEPALGWPDQGNLMAQVNDLLGNMDLPGMALALRESTETHEGWLARSIARTLGLDWSEHLRARVLANPNDQSMWWEWLAGAGEGQIREALALLPRLILLPKIMTGPDLELGLGQEYAQHNIVGDVVARLDEFPGLGADLVELMFRSPVTRNRFIALRTLKAWPADALTETLLAALESAATLDPDERVREEAAELLSTRQ